MKRTRLFTIRMADDEYERLASLARHYGIDMADVIRMLLKREEDRIIARTVASLSDGGAR